LPIFAARNKKSFRKAFAEKLPLSYFYAFKFYKKNGKISAHSKPKTRKKNDLYNAQNIIPCHTAKFLAR